MPNDTDFLTLFDGTQICAPTNIKLMTPFVLREQQDWFEDEIHFVRKVIEPGMTAIDIGANYGLYTTAIANQLSDTDKLWCFEPTPATAAALRETLKANDLESKVELLETGLSDHSGEASFYASSNAELNSLHAENSNDAEKITIQLDTLDQCRARFGWESIDFVKLDAEGEEINILKGGEALFASCSPLVMFELKHGTQVNKGLVDAFTSIGYDIYGLSPGLEVLAPLDNQHPIDGYLLNLFACKSDTASALQARGLLVRAGEALEAEAIAYPPLQTLEGKSTDHEGYRAALHAYLAASDDTKNVQTRYQHMLFAYDRLKQALQMGESRYERLSTYARIAFDIGQRQVGMQICEYMLQRFLANKHTITLSEPFVAMSAGFATLEAAGKSESWAKAMIIDQFIRKHAYSCYFTGAKTLPLFDELKKLGFLQEDMQRRADTLKAASIG